MNHDAEKKLVAPGGSPFGDTDGLTLSLDPSKGDGQFSRAGVRWFVQRMFMNHVEAKSADVETSLNAYLEEARQVLGESEALADLDLSDADQFREATERVGYEFQLPECWAIRVVGFSEVAQEAIQRGDAARAAWAAQCAALSRCTFVVGESLEEFVWRGYRTFGLREIEQAIAGWDDADLDAGEDFWQETLAEHSFVLSQLFSAPTLVIEDQAYVGGKRLSNDQGAITDFMVKNALTGAVALIEIKKPSTKLLTDREYRNGVHRPTAELSGAVAQVQGNRDTLVKEFYTLAKGEPQFFPYDPRCIVIAGHTDQLDSEARRGSFERFRSGFKDVDVATFDEVFGQTKALLDLVRRFPDEGPES